MDYVELNQIGSIQRNNAYLYPSMMIAEELKEEVGSGTACDKVQDDATWGITRTTYQSNWSPDDTTFTYNPDGKVNRVTLTHTLKNAVFHNAPGE